MDGKYGHLYTEADVEKVVKFAIKYFYGGEEPEANKDLDVNQILQGITAGEAGEFKFPYDEPVFVLRARDKRALAAIRYYRDHQSPRAPVNHEENIEDAYQAFDKFRVQHADRMREPD